MQTVKSYLYPIILEVQIADSGFFKTRNRVVYSRPVKIYQGIDNPVQIVCLNQDNKPVDLTGYQVQVTIQDPVNKVSVANYMVDFTDITTGHGSITIDKDTVNELEHRFYKISLRKINFETEQETPIYVDDNYGVPLDLEVLPAYW